MNKPLSLLALFTTSLFLGGCLVIALTLVPFWQSMQGPVFLDYFAQWGPSIGLLMLPLSALAQISLIMACWEAKDDKASFKWWLMSVLCFSFTLVIFVFYFARTNMEMEHKVIDLSILSQTLVTWERLHWLRMAIVLLAIGLGVMGTLAQSRSNSKTS